MVFFLLKIDFEVKENIENVEKNVTLFNMYRVFKKTYFLI